MLRRRRGAVLLVVLAVAAALLALTVWGAARLSWTQAATRTAWDRIAVDFAAIEVEHAARRAVAPSGADGLRAHTLVTTSRFVGRWEVAPVATGVWRVRWGVGGFGGLWRTGEWLSVALEGCLSCSAGWELVPLPGLPPGG